MSTMQHSVEFLVCLCVQQAFSLTINSRVKSGKEVSSNGGLRDWVMEKMSQILSKEKAEQSPWNAVVTRAVFDNDATYAEAKCVLCTVH